MSVFNRILIAVSDDDLSRPALNLAIDLASDQHAQLRLVHVGELVQPQASSASELADIESALREEGDALLRQLVEHAASRGVQAESARLKTASVQDSVADAIAAEAADWGADLVVSGTHARKGIVRWLAGSVSESLARASTVPVLIVRDSDAS
ncbi:MAG: universal stress protein [Hydrogenophaga sp.]|uniref:universal stress protein n=1 Tax=Hydrogenophaga sp. TaxID=1904254 RepID=UPI001D855974|nr:universal stress protein [Hydrogenophaga sp.]MBX3611222.1 universal stress protein [Hydrogenophaga sp.]